jgi:hypothetical protein
LVGLDLIQLQEPILNVFLEGCLTPVLTLVDIFVNVLDTLDAAGGLHVQMTPVLSKKVRVVGNNPATVNILIEAIVPFDPRKDRSMGGSSILRIPISLDLGLLAEGKGKLLGARSWKLGAEHARAVGIENSAWPMEHVQTHQGVQLWVSPLIRHLA